MEKLKIETLITKYRNDELSGQLLDLRKQALEAAENAYAVYSNFQVGAALLLTNGAVVKGNNQENAAYPSGLCAERVALFYAHATYPDVPIDTLAIIAVSKGEVVENISPCGACRQVMLEYENKFGKTFKVVLFNKEAAYVLTRAADLLPITFTKENM